MKNLCPILPVFTLLLICCTFVPAQKFETTVKGRVVDDNGKPVSRAIVCLESLTKNDSDDFIADTVYTDENGKFTVKNISTKAKRRRDLFISGPFPENAINLIDLPPSDNLRRLKPDLRVASVDLNKNNSVNVGDIKIKVPAGIVELTLVKSNGEPYFKTEGDWQSAYYVLRGENGEPVVATGISGYSSRVRVDVNRGLIRFAIAEGSWTIEFLSELELDDSTNMMAKEGYLIAKTDKFTVKKSDKPLELKVVVRTK